MIVSHKHKFIFLKTTKTAGSSFEIALSKYCGPDDIITPQNPREEEAKRELGHYSAQNYQKSQVEYTLSERFKLFATGTQAQKFYNHMTATDVRANVPLGVWEDYLKVAIVRNPFDYAVSRFFWNTRTKRNRYFIRRKRTDRQRLLKSTFYR